MRAFPLIVLAWVLALPAILASATSTPDPTGDERTVAASSIILPTQCHDPRIDIVSTSASWDGSVLTASVTVLDRHGLPTCSDVQLANAGWTTNNVTFTSAGAPTVNAYYDTLQLPGASGSVQCYQVKNGVNEGEQCAGGSVTGNTITWRIPGSGVLQDSIHGGYFGYNVSRHVYGVQAGGVTSGATIFWVAPKVLSIYDTAYPAPLST